MRQKKTDFHFSLRNVHYESSISNPSGVKFSVLEFDHRFGHGK